MESKSEYPQTFEDSSYLASPALLESVITCGCYVHEYRRRMTLGDI